MSKFRRKYEVSVKGLYSKKHSGNESDIIDYSSVATAAGSLYFLEENTWI